MRRKDKEIPSLREIDAIIRGCDVCHLALALENEPYIVPVSFGYNGAAFFFHTAQSGRKIEFLESNNRVCFEFERNVRLQADPDAACKWTFAFESVIGYGRVSELIDPAEKARGLNQIMLHYSGREWELDTPLLARTRVWQVLIDSLTGKRAEEKAGQ
jgi:nitroimidazol reductase NimA-like FMN-containing flavoprotein (pyridoxamine 5'-phosphate oxidase superfamily)